MEQKNQKWKTFSSHFFFIYLKNWERFGTTYSEYRRLKLSRNYLFLKRNNFREGKQNKSEKKVPPVTMYI